MEVGYGLHRLDTSYDYVLLANQIKSSRMKYRLSLMEFPIIFIITYHSSILLII